MASGSKNDDVFLLIAGDEGSCERVSMVLSAREGRGGLEVRALVVSWLKPSVADPDPDRGLLLWGVDVEAVGEAVDADCTAGFRESGRGFAENSSEGRRVRVRRLLKRKSSFSGREADACSVPRCKSWPAGGFGMECRLDSAERWTLDRADCGG